MRVLFNPKSWIRISNTNRHWDNYLWNLLNTMQVECVGEHVILLDNRLIWYRNYPYASGEDLGIVASPGWHHHSGSQAGPFCSRATAMLLRESITKNLVICKLKHPNATHIWDVEDIYHSLNTNR
jgi:hypothetical protein